jgi:signal transduction histidine kinase
MLRKQWISVFVTLQILVFVLLPLDTYAKTKDRLIVGVPVDRCPIFYENPDTGAIEGIGVDLIKLIGAKAGYQVTIKLIKNQSLADALDDTQYDILMPFGSTIKSTSGEQCIISDPLFSTPFTFVTLRGQKLPKLSTLSVGLPASLAGVTQTLHALYPQMNIQLFANMEDCVSSLRSHKVDALLHNSYVWSYILQKPSYKDLDVKPTEAFSMPFCAGTTATEKGQRILNRLNKANARISDSQRNAIALDYTSRPLYRNTLSDIFYLNRGKIISAGIIIAILAILLFLWWRQRQNYIRTLEYTNSQLAKASEANVAFLSSMSHEMRTPLNGIIGFLSFAVESKNPEDMRNYLNKARSSADIMLNLVNDVLDLSKIASAKLQLKPENFDAYVLFRKIIDTIRPQAEAHQITLTTGHSGNMPRMVFADRLRIQQVILNLLSNAIKYTPDGGSVSFFLERKESDENNLNTIVHIKDTGIGMSEEFQTHMFEPFSQEHSVRLRDVQGTGLGLSIVKQMVELMQGRIEVHSILGQGTEFVLFLPIPTSEESTNANHSNATDCAQNEFAALRNKRALLTDDNKMNLEIAATLLRERLKMDVDYANNGQMALDLFAASEPAYYDVILMDIRMPVMNGLDATKAIRALNRPDAKTIPIIAMTADSFKEDVECCISAGMNAHVAKPIMPNHLFRTLADLLGK